MALAQWETATSEPHRSPLPSNIAEQIAEARQTHHRFGQFAEPSIKFARASSPRLSERTHLQRLCAELGIPGRFRYITRPIAYPVVIDSKAETGLCNSF